MRASLAFAAYRAAGGTSPAIAGVGAAVETVHAYSLVHDDLPCMDDDDLRRGRPTTHRQFDVPTATRVGFLLVPVAARVLAAAAELGLSRPGWAAWRKRSSRQAASRGWSADSGSISRPSGAASRSAQLIAVHRGKTGALIRASCVLGGIAAEAPPQVVDALGAFGEDIGLAFQIADDVLDATGTSAELGKTAGRDAQLAKSTYVGLLGVDAARGEAERLARSAVAHLDAAGVPSSALGALAGYCYEEFVAHNRTP